MWSGEGKLLGSSHRRPPRKKDLMTVKGGCSAVRNVTESTGQGRVTEAVEGHLMLDDTHVGGHLA